MKEIILYVNACVREESRTHRLAKALLSKLGEKYEEIKIAETGMSPLTEETLKRRTRLIEEEKYDDEMFEAARRFAAADIIVISAPYWDFSFPALLKVYIENIYVTGIVSKYGSDGLPLGLCKAKKLYYVTTAGGPYDSSYSYDYISTLAVKCFGIKETSLIKAEMLDVDGFDAEEILKNVMDSIWP